MSINQTNILLESVDIQMYIPIKSVVWLSWDKEKGERLRLLRKKKDNFSQAALIERLSEKGIKRARNSITNLEQGGQSKVETEVIVGICEVLQTGLKYFYDDVIFAGVGFKDIL